MSVLIDTNVLTRVLCPSPDEDFAPVRDWIMKGDAKVIIGGKKYAAELRRVKEAALVMAQLATARKVVNVSDDDVDKLQTIVEKIVSPKCDDPHLIALVGVSKCPVVCTRDSRADEFLKDSRLYPWKSFHPGIYRYKRQAADLLTHENAVAGCFTCASCNPHFDAFVEKAGKRQG